MAEAAQVGSRKIEVARPLGEDQAVTPGVQRGPHIVAGLLVAVVVVDQGHLSKGNLLVLGLIDGFRALLRPGGPPWQEAVIQTPAEL